MFFFPPVNQEVLVGLLILAAENRSGDCLCFIDCFIAVVAKFIFLFDSTLCIAFNSRCEQRNHILDRVLTFGRLFFARTGPELYALPQDQIQPTHTST